MGLQMKLELITGGGARGWNINYIIKCPRADPWRGLWVERPENFRKMECSRWFMELNK